MVSFFSEVSIRHLEFVVVFGSVVLFPTGNIYAQASSQSGTNGIVSSQENSPIHAYIEEFFLSEAVRNEDEGELQLTFSTDSREALGTNMLLEVEYGLTERLQLSSETPYGLSAKTNSEVPAGWSSASVGVQYQIIRSSSPFALTAGMSIGIPVKGAADLEFEPELLAAKSFRRCQVHGSFVADVEEGNPSFQYNLATVYVGSKRWFPTLEFNGRRLNDRNAFYATPGLYRHFPHRLEMGAGVPLGLGGVAGRIGIVGKMTWEIGGDRDKD